MSLAGADVPVVLIGEWMGVKSDGRGRELPEDPRSEVRDGVFIVVLAGRRSAAGALADLIRILERWVATTSFEPPLCALVDVRDSEFDPSGSEVRAAALKLGYLGEGKLALLVANDLQFGLGRMLGILAQGASVEVRPFRNGADAHRWLTGA